MLRLLVQASTLPLYGAVASLGMARFGSGNCRRHGSGWEALVLYESNFSFLIQVLGAEVGSYLQFTVFVRFRIFAFFASVPEHTPICLW